MRTWTTTAAGTTKETTDTFGLPWVFPMAGHRTATDTGFMWLHGDGPGSTKSRGALLRSIMAAGHLWAAAGAGFRDPWLSVPCTRRPWLHSLEAAGSTSE